MERPARRDLAKIQQNDCMNYTPALVVPALLAAVLVGCDPAPMSSPSVFPAKTQTNSAVLEPKDYPFARKAEFTKQMRAQLAEINRELDLLAAKIEKSTAPVKAEAEPRIKSLRELADRLKTQLEAAGEASESTWETAKDGTRTAFDALKEGFQQSRQWISEKIAP